MIKGYTEVYSTNAYYYVTSSSRYSLWFFWWSFNSLSFILSHMCTCQGVRQDCLWMEWSFDTYYDLWQLEMVEYEDFEHDLQYDLVLLVLILWMHDEWCLLPVYIIERFFHFSLFTSSLLIHLQVIIGNFHVQHLHVSYPLTSLFFRILILISQSILDFLPWCSMLVVFFMCPCLMCVFPNHIMLLIEIIDCAL